MIPLLEEAEGEGPLQNDLAVTSLSVRGSKWTESPPGSGGLTAAPPLGSCPQAPIGAMVPSPRERPDPPGLSPYYFSPVGHSSPFLSDTSPTPYPCPLQLFPMDPDPEWMCQGTNLHGGVKANQSVQNRLVAGPHALGKSASCPHTSTYCAMLSVCLLPTLTCTGKPPSVDLA